MFVDSLLPAAAKRLIVIGDGAPIAAAAKLLLDRCTDSVVERGSD